MLLNIQKLQVAQIIEDVQVMEDVQIIEENWRYWKLCAWVLEVPTEKVQAFSTVLIINTIENSSISESLDEEVNADMQLTSDSYMTAFGKVTEFMINFENMKKSKQFERYWCSNAKIFLAEITEIMTKIHEEIGIFLKSLKKE